jgi:hypothetical protein
MGMPADENLPEVVPDSLPQALSAAQARRQPQLEEQDPKFAVGYESPLEPPTPAGYPTPSTMHYHGTGLGLVKQETGYGTLPPREEPRIFGVRRRTFWIMFGVLLVIIVAAIGGGVGGAMAAKSKSSQQSGDTPAAANTG